MPSYKETRLGYKNLWAKCAIKQSRFGEVDKVARKLLANRAKYESVETKTGVPWFWIACAHMRESGANFAGVLHNGEHIIGTGRKTKLVPAGRGPFASWEEAAIDALQIKGLHRLTEWSVSRILYEFERFNGFGYQARGVNSPYVWAATNLQQPGKYIADHVWSSTAMDTQLGCAAILKRLCELDAKVNDRVEGVSISVPPTPSVATPPKKINIAKTGTTTGVIVAGGEAARQAYVAGIQPIYIVMIVAATIAVAAAVFLFFHNRKK